MKLSALALLLAASALFAQESAVLASLRYIDSVQGTGAPAASGKKLTVHYTGYLKDGTKFDSSVDRNEPFNFIQGRKQVITGWDIGFEGMKVGGKRRLIIPYQLAYGEQGSGPIPARAELTFDVELLGVADAPSPKPSVDLTVPFAELEIRVLDIARAVPADKYPALAGFFARIVDLNRAALDAADQDEPALRPFEKPNPFTSKEESVKALTESFKAVEARLIPARNGYLSGDAVVFGKSTSVRGIFTALDTMIAEQLGILEAYSHMSKIAFTTIFDLNSPFNQ